ncbi:unnamed protein product [Auanema sp. JU1783]|nr:unnamed protein product [Auanema sp. JU1783]
MKNIKNHYPKFNGGKFWKNIRKKEKLFEKLLENNESAVRPFLEECLNLFCEKSSAPTKNHTPETVLLMSKFYFRLGDYRLACEMVWDCASLTIQNVTQLSIPTVIMRVM